MPCEHYKDALIEVAALGSTPQSELRAHLAGCVCCRAAFDEEQSLFETIDLGLRTRTNVEVPVTLMPRVRALLGESVTTQRRWISSLVPALAGVALAFLLLVIVRSHGPAPNDVAKQIPEVTAPVAPKTGMYKDLSPSNVQVASTGPIHLHAPRTSTAMHSVASSNPEVLVPPDEREGLAQLVATLNEHRDVAAAFVSRSAEKKDTLVAVDPLQISDIEIKPLEGAEAEPSDGRSEKN